MDDSTPRGGHRPSTNGFLGSALRLTRFTPVRKGPSRKEPGAAKSGSTRRTSR